VTKQERERVRRHAAVIAVGFVAAPEDDAGAPWDALGRWRGDVATRLLSPLAPEVLEPTRR
jgi:hypothetical protein